MFDVWAATSIFMAQSIKLQYLSIFDFDVVSLPSKVYSFFTFFHGFLGEYVQKAIHTCISLKFQHGNHIVYGSNAFSTFLVIALALGVLLLLFSLTLTGIMSSFPHIREEIM